VKVTETFAGRGRPVSGYCWRPSSFVEGYILRLGLSSRTAIECCIVSLC